MVNLKEWARPLAASLLLLTASACIKNDFPSPAALPTNPPEKTPTPLFTKTKFSPTETATHTAIATAKPIRTYPPTITPEPTRLPVIFKSVAFLGLPTLDGYYFTTVRMEQLEVLQAELTSYELLFPGGYYSSAIYTKTKNGINVMISTRFSRRFVPSDYKIPSDKVDYVYRFLDLGEPNRVLKNSDFKPGMKILIDPNGLQPVGGFIGYYGDIGFSDN